MLDHHAILQLAAESLAQMKEPTFEGIDTETVRKAFSEVIRDQIWINKFKAKVTQLSDGKVVLVDANVDEFGLIIKGFAHYLALISGSKRQLLIIVAAFPPIIFE